MIKHIVAWDFVEENKNSNLDKMKSLLEELPDFISEIESFEVGLNIGNSDVAKDMVLISSFADEVALQRYADHPEHQRVVQELRKVSSKTMVVDYKV
ncbi:MAG: Dabb family protein [Candidatus Marinimicrobia bacterium]|nr:Dabb family protein [Candidatus Neomarinimicrobiota bacterium]